ncbi:hypothetical protein CI1B_02370 [Bradyrhizobium ivorense]|uniref:Uncharacterized protein n=1 Tax=Bradyrhizobium ivorense TaxID=2511166 RepID=A0A508ST10_9BRAD|nr:hypothetical protein [Bradyrhizobium ivorense]VIO65140.1 hypothetical protein CI1B_02370 [Bradyrhizobium ivorense]VIO71986.1 hypothetical protein CI41S_33530 [Bradyrhizobium ivorense]
MTQPVRHIRKRTPISVHDGAIIDGARAAIAHSLKILRDCQPATFVGRARDPVAAGNTSPAGDASPEFTEEANSGVVPKAHGG